LLKKLGFRPVPKNAVRSHSFEKFVLTIDVIASLFAVRYYHF